MADAIRAEGKAHLLLPRPRCGFCRIRTARVGDLCCFCAEDEESQEQYAAQCAKEAMSDE
jgi:hypothetical protein